MKIKLTLILAMAFIFVSTSTSAVFMACCCPKAEDPYANKCVADGRGGVACEKECITGYTEIESDDPFDKTPICCKGAKDHTGTLNEECCKKAGGGVRTVNGVKKCCRQSSQNS